MSTDVVVTWTGAAGIIAYLVHIHRRRTRSFLESRMLLLLYCLGFLLLIRGLLWIYGGSTLRMLTLLSASLLPLAATLFVESLLCRHVSPPFKAFIALGTLVFVPAGPLVWGRGVELYFQGLTWFTVLTLAWLFWTLLRRDRGDVSRAQNVFVDGVTFAIALAVLFALTDFRIRPDWMNLRLGGLGGLFFVYSCVRLTRETHFGASFALESVGVALKTSALAAGFALVVRELTPGSIAAVISMALGFVMLFTIFDRLRTISLQSRGSSFRRWLLQSDLGSLERLIRSLDRLPLAEHNFVLSGSDLEGYNSAAMAREFDDKTRVLSLSALRRRLAGKEGDPESAEQLIDLLEELGMRQITLLSRRPITFLLLNLSDVTPA